MKTLSLTTKPRGSVMIVAVIAVFIVAAISATLLHLALVNGRAAQEGVVRMRAFEVAEAGVAQQSAALMAGNGPTSTGVTTTGWIPFANGQFNVTVDAVWGAGQDRVTITSIGEIEGRQETVTVEYNRAPAAIHESFLKAIYAGNTDEVNPNGTNIPNQFNYQLGFGGGVDAFDSNTAFDGDLVEGDIYAAGDVFRNQQARLNGEVKGLGNLMLGAAGASNHTAVRTSTHIKPPDLAAMNYGSIADYNVKSLFGATKSGTLASSNPAHIFTKNPTNRSTETSSTPGQDDYFLEDLNDGTKSWADPITPTAGAGQGKIYYIEGNMWIHNLSTIEFKWAANTKITIVVKGNVYISDDVRYQDANSMVAFIAVKDPANPTNSGDIKFGDTRYGTVDFFDGIMYAENNFEDVNTSSAGSAHYEVKGAMLAGNQVKLNRDYSVNTAHWEWVPSLGRNVWVPKGQYQSEFSVRFDTRLQDPNFEKPPGLPVPDGNGPAGAWSYLGWRLGA